MDDTLLTHLLNMRARRATFRQHSCDNAALIDIAINRDNSRPLARTALQEGEADAAQAASGQRDFACKIEKTWHGGYPS